MPNTEDPFGDKTSFDKNQSHRGGIVKSGALLTNIVMLALSVCVCPLHAEPSSGAMAASAKTPQCSNCLADGTAARSTRVRCLATMCFLGRVVPSASSKPMKLARHGGKSLQSIRPEWYEIFMSLEVTFMWQTTVALSWSST